jgi:hypothetical protein
VPDWVCAQCGRPGIPQPGFTLFDGAGRYAVGTCTGDHVGKQNLVRVDVQFTEKKKPKRKRK